MGDTVYIVGESRTNNDNSITAIYRSFYIGFEILADTGEIVDLGCTHTISTTEKILKSIFIGKSMDAAQDINEEIKRRYHGTSQKAVLVAYKEALRKYIEVKMKYYE